VGGGAVISSIQEENLQLKVPVIPPARPAEECRSCKNAGRDYEHNFMTCQFHGSDEPPLCNSVPNPTAIPEEGEWLPAKSHNTKGRGGSERFNSERQPQDPVAPSNGSCRTKTKKEIFLNTVFSHHTPLPSAPSMVAKSQEKSSAMADGITLPKISEQGSGSSGPSSLKIPNFDSIPGMHFAKTPATKTRAAFSETSPPRPFYRVATPRVCSEQRSNSIYSDTPSDSSSNFYESHHSDSDFSSNEEETEENLVFFTPLGSPREF
jgi:hypothetical protein